MKKKIEVIIVWFLFFILMTVASWVIVTIFWYAYCFVTWTSVVSRPFLVLIGLEKWRLILTIYFFISFPFTIEYYKDQKKKRLREKESE